MADRLRNNTSPMTLRLRSRRNIYFDYRKYANFQGAHFRHLNSSSSPFLSDCIPKVRMQTDAMSMLCN